MKNNNTFDRYLQEALKELEKPCEEFSAQRCERLLNKSINLLMAEEFRKNANGFKKECVEENPFKEAENFSESRATIGVNNAEGYHEKPDFTNSNYDGGLFAFSGSSAFLGTLGGFVSSNVFCSLAHRENLCTGIRFLFEVCRLHGICSKRKNTKSGQGGQERATGVQVVIDNTTGQTVQAKAQTPERALAEVLSRLTPGVKTIVED